MTIANELPLLGKEKLRKILVGLFDLRNFTTLIQSHVTHNFTYSKYASLPGCRSLMGLDKPSANGVFSFMSPYQKRLLDPRWQRKRAEILQRDNYTCQLCLDERSTLAVHHKEYLGNPWEVPATSLKTVCCHCHDAIHAIPEYEILEVKKGVSFYAGCMELVCFTNRGVLFLYSFYKDDNKVEIIKVLTNKIAA
jgi:hypothetical protein